MSVNIILYYIVKRGNVCENVFYVKYVQMYLVSRVALLRYKNYL